MSSKRKIAYLEQFFDSDIDGNLHSMEVALLLRSMQGDNPQIFLAGASDENPQVRKAGLKALEVLFAQMRGTIDWEESIPLPQFSPQMKAAIDELVLTGIRDPQGEHFKEYSNLLSLLMTKGDHYHAAAIEVINQSDDDLFKAQQWLNLFFALGPQAEAKEFILQALNADSAPQTISFASYLGQGLLDPDFIEPLAQIVLNTELEHTPRHRALSALATYGAAAQSYLPQLRGLPHEADWKESCREDAARSIRHIEEGKAKETMFLTLPDGTPWRNINPLW